MKIKLNSPIIVEGKYDKIRLENIFDAPIITTEGFGIFKNTEKMLFIKKMAEKFGVIVLTDSDSAGNVIRNHIKGFVSADKIKNIYLPEIKGKEKRKPAPSKQGFLGVEGIDDEIIINAFSRAGITEQKQNFGSLTKLDLYNMGLVGGSESAEKRKALLEKAGLPKNLSVNALVDALNMLYTNEEFIELFKEEK